MKDEYGLNLRKLIKPMKYALNNPGKALIFILQVVRHGSGPSLKYTYKKMLETRTGGEMAYKSEEISEYLPGLVNRPEKSVGKAAADCFQHHRLAIVAMSRKNAADQWIEVKHPYSWMARRYRDTHDIWHILTNYPTTAEGEMCMIMFSYAQTRSLAWLVISLSILFTLLIRHPSEAFTRLRMVYEAYRNGKKAKFLLAEDYDKLLSENLDSARERLNIRLPRVFINKYPNFLKL